MSSIPNPITPEYLAESKSGRMLAAAIPCTIIATTAVALRFIARNQVRAKIWWDDYTIVFALMFLYAFNILLMVDAELWGLGRHIPYLDEIQVVKFLKALLTVQLMYFCQQAVIKTSLLLLYYRIFNTTKHYRWAIYAVGVIVFMCVCCISIVRITTLQDYNPVDPTWNCVSIFLWTTVESSIAIFSACLPTMRPLLGSLMHTRSTHRSKGSNSKRTGDSGTDSTRAVWGKATPDINTMGGFTRLDEENAMGHLRGDSGGGGVRSWVTSEETDSVGDTKSYPMAIMQKHAISQREDRPPKLPLKTPPRVATKF
ncbi:hypothetical protein P7C71_g5907, partial [Lecanoromycetidae sp. Uapishka_2]